jgi:Curli production assembly/transport component CsgG
MNHLLFVLLFLVLFSTGCAPKIKVSKLEPGRADEAASLKKIAVMPFDGPDGAAFANQFESMLTGIRVNDQAFFQVLNRSSMDTVFREQRFSQSGDVDPDTAANVGKVVGAKGIYTGQVNVSSVRDSYYDEERSECSRKDPNSRKCLSWNRFKVNCTKRVASFSVTPRLIDVETARVVYSENYARSSEDKRCSDHSSPLKDGRQMKRELQEQILKIIRNDIAPYYVQIEVRLIETTDDLTTERSRQSFASGLEFAKSGRFDRACEIWGEIRSEASSSVSLLHNLAVCAETKGNLKEAVSLIREADRKLKTPDDTVSSSLKRIEESVYKQKKIRQQTATDKMPE